MRMVEAMKQDSSNMVGEFFFFLRKFGSFFWVCLFVSFDKNWDVGFVCFEDLNGGFRVFICKFCFCADCSCLVVILEVMGLL